MKNIINSIPGYKIFEYLLVLNPHEELRNKIMQVKKIFMIAIKLLLQCTASRILRS